MAGWVDGKGPPPGKAHHSPSDGASQPRGQSCVARDALALALALPPRAWDRGKGTPPPRDLYIHYPGPPKLAARARVPKGPYIQLPVWDGHDASARLFPINSAMMPSGRPELRVSCIYEGAVFVVHTRGTPACRRAPLRPRPPCMETRAILARRSRRRARTHVRPSAVTGNVAGGVVFLE